MNAFFLTVLNMSISASWIVLAVLLLRVLLKKAPKWIIVLLWAIVAVRLICPFSIESVMSLIPSSETINPEILVGQAPVINPNIPVINGVENPVIGGTDTPVIGEPITPVPDTTPVNSVQTVITVFSYVWLGGIAGMLAYTVISYFRVKAKIGTAVRLRDHIFQSESVVSPFVLGLIKPKIYLPFGMDGQDMEYVIAHENAHICRKDHWWKPIGFLILTLHWFNPLLWLGYVLLCRDIELACDEKVVKELDFQQKADHSQALLNCSVNRRIIAACPLAFGEVGIKERVKSVLNYKKPAFWIIVVAIVASIVAAVCFLTDPVKDKQDTEQFFSEGFLFFDIGAESMESIESCTIIHDGNPTELILSEEDTLLFSRYAYTDKVPVPELSEIFAYPKTKRIQIAVGDRNVLLYLMQDGRIAVNLPEKGFSMYQAEEQDVITPTKFQQLIAKYTKEPSDSTDETTQKPSDNTTEGTESTNTDGFTENSVPPTENIEDVQITVSDAFIANCNRNSGGYINYLNGKYYYRNTEGNKLFMCDADGKNAVCIDSCTSGEEISVITASETAIYYSKSNRLDPILLIPTGDAPHTVLFVRQIFKFCDGKVTALSEKNVLDYALTKDYIFYTVINSVFLATTDTPPDLTTDIIANATTDADADIKLYRMKHDGTEKTAIFDLGLPYPLNVSEDRVYAYGYEGFVLMDFDGKTSSNYHHQLHTYSPAVNQSTIYYVNTNGSYYLCKTKSSDESTASWLDNQQVVIADKVRAYTVYDGRFVYERLTTDEILITDENGANPKVICKGTNPISLNGHLFYLDDNGAIKVADI